MHDDVKTCTTGHGKCIRMSIGNVFLKIKALKIDLVGWIKLLITHMQQDVRMGQNYHHLWLPSQNNTL